LQKIRHVKPANFNRIFPKLHMEHLSGLCTEPFNLKYTMLYLTHTSV